MTTWLVDTPPVHLGAGVVARVVSDGENLRVELCEKGRGWVPGPEPTGRVMWSIDTAPAASPALLARVGIPDITLDLTEADADWLHRAHREREP